MLFTFAIGDSCFFIPSTLNYSPDVVLLFIPYLVFAWLIILTKLHYLTLVLVELFAV